MYVTESTVEPHIVQKYGNPNLVVLRPHADPEQDLPDTPRRRNVKRTQGLHDMYPLWHHANKILTLIESQFCTARTEQTSDK